MIRSSRWIGALPIVVFVGLRSVAQDPPPTPSPSPVPEAVPVEAPAAEAEAAKVPEEPAAASSRFGHVLAEIQIWSMRSSGTQFEAARVVGSGAAQTSDVFLLGPEGEKPARYRLDYEFPGGEYGGLRGEYWSDQTLETAAVIAPGQFIYYASLPVGPYVGFRNDGLQDGFYAITETSSRDFRLDYTHLAYHSPRVRVDWGAGYRSIAHRRVDESSYYALAAPEFPTNVNPPISDRAPGVDYGSRDSTFEGQGLDVLLDARFEVYRKVWIEASLGAAVLWGRADSGLNSTTSVYVRNRGQVGATVLQASEYAVEFQENPTLDGISQVAFTSSAVASQSSNVQVLDIALGVRWNVWKGVELGLGYRASRWIDVVAMLSPDQISVDLGAEVLRIQSALVAFDSVNYNGFYLGAGYRY